MSYRVPFVDPKAHYQRLKFSIDAAIIGCLARGDLIDRHDLQAFEEHFAAFVGTKYAVGVNSGYHALQFSLQAAGISRGDEVITTGHTFVATVSAIVNVGAHPVLAEVGDDYNLDPAALEAAITPRTRAVIPVSLNGRACAMGEILAIANKHDLAVIEDSAQALGAEYCQQRAGSFGAAGCFSFYPFKMLGGFGDGGAVTTNDPDIARTARWLRYNGEDRKTGEYHHHGQTALLDNVQAAVLDVKLKYLETWIEHRRKVAGLYREGLSGVADVLLPHFDESKQRDVFQNYVIRADARDRLKNHLEESGVETLVHWPKPMWRHPGLLLRDPGLTNTEALCREVLSLPISAETTEEQVEIVAESIRSFYLPVRARSARCA
jgi:dTDP-4-amino-4,6-dideoxygalactose transaminase